MSIRDLLVTFIVFSSLIIILRRPYVGVLVWSWLSYMNPHRLTWGFAYYMPFSQIVAITLLISILFHKSKKSIPVDTTVVLWILYIVWMGVSTAFALFSDAALEMYIKIIKIQLVTFLTMMLITDQKKMDQLIWVIVLSIGFFCVKGGAFTLLTAGSFRVWGPPDSFIEENNTLAVATLMIIPLMGYLYKINENKWIRYGLLLGIVLSLVSVLGSQSRGALIAILSVGGYFWLLSKNKMISGVAIVVVALVGFSFMPDSWHERMSTIETYQEDRSAMGRINAWHYCVNVANDRLTGAGLNSWKLESFFKYAPDPLGVHAAHSIYFGPLGDHGWPGLMLFLGVLLMTWRNLSVTVRLSDNEHEIFLAKMIKISMVAFMTGGAFLSLAYFDLSWHLIAFSVLLKARCVSRVNGDEHTPVKKKLKKFSRRKFSRHKSAPYV